MEKDKTFSENENRYLAEAPTCSIDDFLSGDFQSGLESYLNDQICLRDQWITGKTAVQKAIGNTDIGGAYIGKEGYDFEKILPEDVHKTQVLQNAKAVSDYFATCQEQIEPSKLSFLLVPTSGFVLADKLPNNAILFDQQFYLNQIKHQVGDDKMIDVSDVLKEHASEELYYHTDHHWTTRGALYAYKEWCKKTGHVASISNEDLETVTEVFRGSLYSKVLDYDSAYDKIEIATSREEAEQFRVTADGKDLGSFYQEEKLAQKDKYTFFFGGNYGEVVIENPDAKFKTQKNLLVIKDSFANTFVPLIAKEYNRVYMIDLRYSKQSMKEYLKKNEITDVLVLYNVSNFISDKNLHKLNR